MKIETELKKLDAFYQNKEYQKIEPFLVASTVNVIAGQRLVRKVCDSCKVSYTQERNVFLKHFPDELVSKYFGKDKEIRIYKGKGCPVCHDTGYSGRIGIFEILEES